MKSHSWTLFESAAAQCDACGLSAHSKCYKLKGEGPRGAQIALVGEAPGWTEERDERPFVGRAGQLLDGCITEAGLNRDHLFLTNSVRCRPINLNTEKDRKPTLDEVDACRGYTLEELHALKPKVIVALGDTASSMLLSKRFGGIRERRGKVTWSDEWNAWIVESLHPSFALRQYAQRHFIIEDLKTAKRLVDEGGPREVKPTEIEVVLTLKHLERAKNEIIASGHFHFDWETYGPHALDPTRGDNENGLHLTKARGFCLSIATREGHAYVIPRYLSGITPHWGRSLSAVDDALREIFLSDCRKGGFHVAFDISITQSTLGVKPTHVDFCGMIAHHALNNHLVGAHGLKSCVALYTSLGRYDDELDNWLTENGYTKEGKPDHDFIWKAPDAIVHKYNGMDSDGSLRLEHIFVPQLHEEGLWKIFTTDLMPVALEHQEIDRIGVHIDVPYLEKISKQLGDGLIALKTQITEMARVEGHIGADADFNPNSHDQVAALLYDAQGLPILARTDGGKPATGEEFLLQLKDMSEYIPLILQYRAFTKVKGTWIDGTKSEKGQKKALRAVLDEDGYARMNTLVHGTETFRFVTRRPFAVHTFPKTVKGMPSVRALIIPADGYTFLDADYVQQEFVIQSIVAGQWDMVEAILDRGEDAHEAVAYDLGGVKKADYLATEGYEYDGLVWKSKDDYNTYKSIRSKWKSVNFMVMFRGQAKKLARMALGCTGDYKRGVVCKISGSTVCDCEQTAQQWIRDYYERYEAIKWWQYRTIKLGYEKGRSWTPFGTYRKLPAFFDADPFMRYEAERQACNAPIQISGAHVMRRAMLGIQARFRKEKFPGRVVMSIHDELITEVRTDLIDEGEYYVRRYMEQPFPELAGRSLRVDVAVASCWGG
jgi:uracil-DNA glycosylase family 4